MDAPLSTRVRLLDCSRIHPFERRSPDEEWSGSEPDQVRVVRHPFLVCRFGRHKYCLLDATPLFHKLADRGVMHIPVQVCSRRHLIIRSGRLGLVGFTCDDLNRLAMQYPQRIRVDRAGGEVPEDSLELEFTFAGSGPRSVWLRHHGQLGCPVPFDNVFRAIAAQGRYSPIAKLIGGHPNSVYRVAACSGTVQVPPFSIDDLIAAATSGCLFPPNVVSVSSRYRVFSIDFPLSVLESDIPLNEKGLFLRDLIALREQSCKTSFFEGQIYLLNR